jgi:hypothetical protein
MKPTDEVQVVAPLKVAPRRTVVKARRNAVPRRGYLSRAKSGSSKTAGLAAATGSIMQVSILAAMLFFSCYKC